MVFKNTAVMIIILLILLGVGGALYFGGFFQATFQEPVYVPEFGHVLCDRLPNDVNLDVKLAKGINTITCGPNTVNAYLRDGCDVFIRQTDTALSLNPKYKVLDALGNEKASERSIVVKGSEILTTHLNVNEKIIYEIGFSLFGTYDTGDFTARIKGTSYGLRVQERGFLSLTKNCRRDSLTANYIPLDSNQPIIGFTPENYIIGLSPITDSRNVFTFKGKLVYTSRLGYYYPVKTITGADGRQVKVADVKDSPLGGIFDKDLECLPSMSADCTSDGKLRSTRGEGSCDSNIGLPINYVPISSSKQCLLRCVDGSISQTECKELKECTAEKPYRNPITGECETAEVSRKTSCEEGQELVEKDTPTCAGRLLCQLGITEEEIITTRSCVPKTTFWTYIPLILLGLALIIIAFLVPLRKK